MNFALLIQIVTPGLRVLLLVIALLLVAAGLALAQPWIAGQLAGALLAEPDAVGIGVGTILGAWLLLLVIRSLVQFASDYLNGSTGELMAAALRTRLYQHMQGLPLAYFHQQRPGDMLTLLANDAEIVSGFVTETLVQLLPLAVTFLGALLLMLWIDVRIGLLAGLLLPLYFLVIKLIGRRIRPLARAWLDAYSDLFSLVEENLKLLPLIKSFVRENYETGRFESSNERVLGLSRRQILHQSVLVPAMGLLAGLGLLLLLWLGAAEMQQGRLSAADLVSLLLYAMLLSQPLKGLAAVYGEIQRTRGAAERLLEFLSAAAEPEDRGAAILEVRRGAIEYNRVSFGYRAGSPVIRDLTLSIRAGETVAITGANGAGKSTLVHLLLRYADPAQGRILLDGVDIRNVTLASLRRQIGLVAQHTLLLNATVAENIAYGEPLVEQRQIERAATIAQAAGFIAALPQGYQTSIGDQGLTLSGGQRQRLALARALLKDPPILVFDEATAMFDPAGESAFVQAGSDVLRDKTVILISHRPGSLALADRVLQLRDGRIYEAD